MTPEDKKTVNEIFKQYRTSKMPKSQKALEEAYSTACFNIGVLTGIIFKIDTREVLK